MAVIQKDLNLKDNTINWFASILVVGQIIGCLIGGPISDIFGRRSSILTFQTISFFGWILVSLAPLFGGSTDSVLILFLGRFIHGLADSMGVSPAIMFIAEISTTKFRGCIMNSALIA